MDPAVEPTLHPLLAARWSPTTFDPSHQVGEPDVECLLEAARWAPSAGNSQPWAFIAGRRADVTHQRLVRHLTGSSAAWAPDASVLVANLSHRYVQDTDWEYSDALYDLGQAVAHMTVQAQSLGLHARQFRAFRRVELAGDFGVPDNWEVTTMTTFGRPRSDVPPTVAPAEPPPSRARRSVEQLICPAARSSAR